MIYGDLAALLSAAMWAVASVLFTREGRRTRPVVMNLVKSGGAAVLFLVVLLAAPPGPLGRPESGWIPQMGPAVWLSLSGFIGIGLGDTFYFSSLARIGVRRTMLLALLSPGFAAVGAVAAGSPLPGSLAAAGILVTLVGIVLVIRVAPVSGAGAPPAAGFSLGKARLGALGLGILSATCQGVGIVLAKESIAETGVIMASLIRLAAGAMGLLLVDLMRGNSGSLVREVLAGFRQGRLLLAAFIGTFVGFYLFQLAILLGSPPVTAALVGTSPLFAIPLAARFLGERLPWQATLGTIVAVIGVALVVLD